MYNYHTFVKTRQINNKCEQAKKQYYKSLHLRQKMNPSLVHSHKKRIQGYMLTMIDKPIVVTQYISHSPSFRDEDKSKNLSSNAFYLKKQTEEQRINESMHKNSELDEIPFNNTFSHRFRDYRRSQKSLKYKPFNHNFRIKQFLDTQCLNYLPNDKNKKIDKNLKKLLKKEVINYDEVNKKINKSLLPLLHNKTYFNSVKNLYCLVPSSTPPKRLQKNVVNNTEDMTIDSQIKKQSSKHNSDRLCRKQNSREALIKCNMLTPLQYNKENIAEK